MNSKRLLIAGAVIVVLIAGGIIGWLLFTGNSPEEATIGDAVNVVQSEGTDGPTTTAASTEAGVDGTWTVDTTIGEFSFEDATSSFAGFRVAEELRGIGAVDAVGRTPDVTGTIEIEGTTMTSGSFTAQLATLTTDRALRDGAVQRSLSTSDFPEATFVVTSPVDFGAIPDGGSSVAVTVTGDLTVKGITNQAVLSLDAQLVNGVIVVVGQIPVVFADFDVSVPSAPSVLSAEDNGVIEVQLFFTR